MKILLLVKLHHNNNKIMSVNIAIIKTTEKYFSELVKIIDYNINIKWKYHYSAAVENKNNSLSSTYLHVIYLNSLSTKKRDT